MKTSQSAGPHGPGESIEEEAQWAQKTLEKDRADRTRKIEAKFAHLVRRHPCLSEGAAGKAGRIHLPVSPACNIQCGFCRRGFNKWEQRPGVARSVMTPEAAVAKVEEALVLCPELTVVGVAGPGDSLATDHALAALRAVRMKCETIFPSKPPPS